MGKCRQFRFRFLCLLLDSGSDSRPKKCNLTLKWAHLPVPYTIIGVSGKWLAIACKCTIASYQTSRVMNYYLVWILVQSRTDRHKVIIMSPPCIRTGVLKIVLDMNGVCVPHSASVSLNISSTPKSTEWHHMIFPYQVTMVWYKWCLSVTQWRYHISFNIDCKWQHFYDIAGLDRLEGNGINNVPIHERIWRVKG